MTYYSIELSNVGIIEYTIGHSKQADVPTETMSLNFEEIKVTYTEYDSEGKSKGNVEFTWKAEDPDK